MISMIIAMSFSAIAAETAPPNILFIAIDDLRVELGCYGAKHIISPNIDKLASQGTLFRQAYCQQALCNPSRASVLTGLRPGTSKVWDLSTNFREINPDIITLPEHFKNNAYHSQGMGKIYHMGHGNTDDAQSWSVPHRVPKGWRYALGKNIALMKQIRAEHKRKKTAKNDKKETIKGPPTEMADVADNAYKDGATVDLAIKTLDKIKDKPFFLAVGLTKPHLPFCAPKKYWDLYDPAAIEIPKKERPQGAPDIAFSRWDELRDFDGMPKEGYVSDEQTRKLIHGYYACVSYVDAQVGRLLAELDRLDLRKNTIVVLWGDHGWKTGTYGNWCKHTNFEVDTRAPLIISVPGLKPQVTNKLVELVDIYPTLAALCGLTIPAHCEGSSMIPLLKNGATPWKNAAFSEYPKGANTMGYSIRSGKWRYTEWINSKKGEVTKELYDHSKTDIAERNWADSPEHKVTIERLSKILAAGQGWKVIQEKLNKDNK